MASHRVHAEPKVFTGHISDVVFLPHVSVWLEFNNKKELTGRRGGSPSGAEAVRSDVTHYIKQRGNCWDDVTAGSRGVWSWMSPPNTVIFGFIENRTAFSTVAWLIYLCVTKEWQMHLKVGVISTRQIYFCLRPQLVSQLLIQISLYSPFPTFTQTKILT